MVYLITTATLIATVAAFFLWARRGLSAFGWLQWVLRIVAALPLLASGVLHFTRTALMASIIPPFFPVRPQLVLLTGVLEFAGAVGLLLPALTRAGLRLSCGLHDRHLPRKRVRRGSDGRRTAHAQRAGSISHAGCVYPVVADRGLGDCRDDRDREPQVPSASGFAAVGMTRKG